MVNKRNRNISGDETRVGSCDIRGYGFFQEGSRCWNSGCGPGDGWGATGGRGNGDGNGYGACTRKGRGDG